MSTYQYKECGLDYVFLENGFKIVESPYGKGVSIENEDELLVAIAEAVISSPRHMTGKELRFIRSVMGLSQKRLGEFLGVTRGAIANVEDSKRLDAPLSDQMDHLLRYVCAGYMKKDSALRQLIDIISEEDDAGSISELTFKSCNRGHKWVKESTYKAA